ncbi:hypothetical protein LCGC14_2630830, partial [marine sediment metagenome]
MERLNLEFFELCERRHNTGADEYGPLKFLDVNLPEFIYEELADFANYARFLYISVRLLEEIQHGFLIRDPAHPTPGDESLAVLGGYTLFRNNCRQCRLYGSGS